MACPINIHVMKNLADTVLDYFWFLEFSDDEYLDPDEAVKLMEGLVYQIENDFTPEEKHALSEAARRRLDWWLSEPDENGYTPRKLLTEDQKEFLELLIAGRFDGGDGETDDEY
jgi:hypothetical protein